MADNMSIVPTTAAAVPPKATAVQGSAQTAARQVSPESGVKQVDAAAKAEATQGSVEQAQASVELLQASVDKLNQFMKQGQRSLSFSVEEGNEGVVVRVSDKLTNELIRQIPTEEALAIREHLDSVLGMLFSDKA